MLKFIDHKLPDKKEMETFLDYIWESRVLNCGVITNLFTELIAAENSCKMTSIVDHGHSAISLALKALNLKKGSEVITTPYSFVSTTQAILENDLVPVFCDIKEDFTIDESKIEEHITDKTRVILPVHMYGNICNVDIIDKIAKKYNLFVVYDAAHAYREKFNGRSIMNFGTLTATSFHHSKLLSTAEGGAIFTNDENLYKKIERIKSFGYGIGGVAWDAGENAKIDELRAAFGICSLNHLDEAIKARKEISTLYDVYLKEHFMCGQKHNQKVTQNYSYYPVILKNKKHAESVLKEMKERKIECRRLFYPIIPDQPFLAGIYKTEDIPIAKEISEKTICLPVHEYVTNKDCEVICKVLLY